VNVSFDNIFQYFVIHILFFQYFFHVLTFFLKLCQSGDWGKGPEHGKGIDQGKGPIPSTTSTENDEYISNEETFDSTNPLQTIELSLRKANREFQDLVDVGPETDEDFLRIV
jgi:hypothetical protein